MKTYLYTLLFFSVVFLTACSDSAKIAYVEINTLYSEFDMKQELEKKYTEVEEARTILLDSLKLQVNTLGKKMDMSGKKNSDLAALYQVKTEEFFNKKKQFEENNALLMQQYNEQILNQLNQYVKDYGEQYNYKFIFGANGEGTLMYASQAENITEEVKIFINSKYAGLEK